MKLAQSGTMSIDEFDTPPQLAAKIIQVAGQLCKREPRIIADFAVGTGELLTAAKRRWPNAAAFGCDISSERVSYIGQSGADWTVAQCDFLDCGSRDSLSTFEVIKSGIDLAVLNPPFTARGGTRVEVNLDGRSVRCSPAMAFVLIASQYLRSDGSLVVLLPAGALKAERDRGAREVLRQLGDFQAVHRTTERFPGGNLNVTIAYLKRGAANPSSCMSTVPKGSTLHPKVKVLRGTLQMHRVPASVVEGSIPLVHSTELQSYKMRIGQKVVPSGTRSISGPAILIHRVGKPRKDKVAYVLKSPPFAISDCVVALLCPNENECIRLHQSLIEHYSLLKQNYIGSGAPYITINRIQRVLHDLGVSSEVVSWQESALIAD